MLNIITAEQRLKEKKGHKMVVCNTSLVFQENLKHLISMSLVLVNIHI